MTVYLRFHTTTLWLISESCRARENTHPPHCKGQSLMEVHRLAWRLLTSGKKCVHVCMNAFLCAYVLAGPTWMLQQTMSIAKRRNSRDIPYSCCWCWVGILQDREGFSPHRGAYLRSPHCLDDTERHNPSKLIANTLLITLAQLGSAKQENQNRKRLGQIYHTAITPRFEGMQKKKRQKTGSGNMSV